jgi:hypothetical protein
LHNDGTDDDTDDGSLPHAMASQRLFQLGLRRAAAPSLRIQPAGRIVQRRYACPYLYP